MNLYMILDTETTGLDYQRHAPWEVGAELIRVDWDDRTTRTLGRYEAFIELPAYAYALQLADPVALAVGRFHERYQTATIDRAVSAAAPDRFPPHRNWRVDAPGMVAHELIELARLDPATDEGEPVYLVGACPWFDDLMLRHWIFNPAGRTVPWHYHLQDVENLANGFRAGGPHADSMPIASSRKLGEALGVTPQSEAEHHTAMGDVAWARRMFEAVHQLTPA